MYIYKLIYNIQGLKANYTAYIKLEDEYDHDYDLLEEKALEELLIDNYIEPSRVTIIDIEPIEEQYSKYIEHLLY